MRILFTICGRAGSKGFKNKNLKFLEGVPLVYYSLAAIALFMKAHSSDEVTIALNTDSEELVQLVKRQHDLTNIVYVERKKDLAGDRVAKIDVIKDTYEYCRDVGDYDVVVDLDITSPLRRLMDIEAAISELLNNSDFDLVYSVVPARRSPYFNMVEKKGKYYRRICETGYVARQQAPVVYEMNASIYAYNPSFLNKQIDKTILEYNCGIIQMVDYLVLDIDSEEDFARMNNMLVMFSECDLQLNEMKMEAQHLYNKV